MIFTNRQNISEIEDTLIGTAHDQRTTIIGQDGYERFKSIHPMKQFDPTYGHYLKVNNLGDRVRLSTDHFGLFKLYRYSHLDTWAISDSIFELVTYVKSIGGSLSPHSPSAYAFLAKYGVGQQLSSFKTTFCEIELIPHWHDIVIDADGMKMVQKPPVVWSHNLTEAISETGAFFSSLTKSYLDHGLDPFILLSGGLDSRCTAVAMISGLALTERAKIETYTMSSEKFLKERDVALSLSQTLGMRNLEKAKPQRRPNWSEWKHTYLGSNSLLTKFSRFTAPDMVFGGSCAGNIKPFYEWSNGVSDIAFPESVPAEIREDVLRDIQSAVSSFAGGFSNDLSEGYKHFQMFRNRFHFGSGVRDSIFNYAPFVFAILSARTSPQDVSGIYRTLYELGGPDVFNHPFDNESKSFNSEIPGDWRKDVRETLKTYNREIFFTIPSGYSYVDLTGGTPHTGARAGNQIISPEMIEDCKKSIAYVRHHDLVDEAYISRAQKQLNRAEGKGESVLPFLCPELLGVLSLAMAEL